MAWNSNSLLTNTSNPSPNHVQLQGDQSEKDVNYNRASAVRRDTDTVKNISFTLKDIDSTIMSYLDTKLNLQVVDNGEVIKVPIIYGSQEKWMSVKKEGFLRDNQGKILLPAFMLRRSSVENNKELATFNRYLTYQTIMDYSEKNKYDRFDLLNKSIFKSKPTKQIYAVTLPNHVLIKYECVIWTDYVDQNNKILEQINFAARDYWGDALGLKFRVRVENYNNEIEVEDNNDRNVKSSFDLTVYGYLLNDTYTTPLGKPSNTTQKLFTVRKIKLRENLSTESEMYQINDNVLQNQASNLITDFEDIGSGLIQKVKSETTPLPKTKDVVVNTKKTLFHPPPKSLTDYGENGWVSYDNKYIYLYSYPNGWLKREILTFDYDYSSQTYISGYDCNNNPIYTTVNRRPINTAFRIFQRFPDKFYHQVPYQSSDYGEDGWISYDGTFFYIYSQQSWRRVPITLFN